MDRIFALDDAALAAWLGRDLAVWATAHGVNLNEGEILTGNTQLTHPLMDEPFAVVLSIEVVAATPETVTIRISQTPTVATLEAMSDAVLALVYTDPSLAPAAPEDRDAVRRIAFLDEIVLVIDRQTGVTARVSRRRDATLGEARRREDLWDATIRRVE